MSKKQLVSVVMPVFNGGPYLSTSIESILNQSYSHIEFIIINDGSADNSLDIIQSYNDHRIKVISHSVNKGLSYSLNEAIGLANGKYVARMDADDVSMVDRISTQVDYMERSPDIDICATNVISIDSLGKVISKPWWKNSGRYVNDDLIWGNPIAHPSVIMKKSLLQSLGVNVYKNLKYVEDYDLWLRLARNTKIWRTGEILIKHREHKHNIFSDGSGKGILAALKLNEAYIEKNYHISVSKYHKNLTEFIGYGQIESLISIGEYLKWIESIGAKIGTTHVERIFLIGRYFMKLTRSQKLNTLINIW